MSAARSSDRALISRIAAHESWARTPDRSARTANGRAAFIDRFEHEVDPDGVLDPAERARRAEHKRKAYFTRLALRSAQSRRKGKAPLAEADEADATLAAQTGGDAA
jgi:hypothetical protein